MRSLLRSPLVAALLGGAVVAVALLALDARRLARDTTTVVQQAPLSRSPRRVTTAAQHGLTAHRHLRARRAGRRVHRAPRSPQARARRSALEPGRRGDRHRLRDRPRRPRPDELPRRRRRHEVTVGFERRPRRRRRECSARDASNDLALLQVDPDGRARAAAAGRLEHRAGRRPGARDRQPVRARPHAHDRRRVRAAAPDHARPNGFTIQHVIQTDAVDQPRQLGRSADRRRRPRDRDQLADRHRRRQQRERRHRLRGADQHGQAAAAASSSRPARSRAPTSASPARRSTPRSPTCSCGSTAACSCSTSSPAARPPRPGLRGGSIASQLGGAPSCSAAT